MGLWAFKTNPKEIIKIWKKRIINEYLIKFKDFGKKIKFMFEGYYYLCPMKIGEKLFEFRLPATDGNTYSKYSFADRYALLIIVSCNHCSYSRVYWNRIIKLWKKFEQDDLAIMVISGNDAIQYPQDSFENMKKLANQLFKGHFPYLYDEDQKVIKGLGAVRTPEVFLFNSKRELVYKGAIDDSWENEHSVTRVYLEDAIEYTLDGLDVDFPEIPAVGCSIKWKKENN